MSQQDLPLTFNQMGQACCRCQGYEVKRHLQGLFEARTELIELPALDSIAGQIEVAHVRRPCQGTAKQDKTCRTIRFRQGNSAVELFLYASRICPRKTMENTASA